MARRRGAGSLSSGELDAGARAASSGVKALSGAFGELSKKGELSAQSINQFAGAVAQVNPLLGVLTAAIGATVQSYKMLEELDLKDSMVQFGAGAKAATDEFDRFVARTTAGVGTAGELREKMRELAEAQAFLRGNIEAVNREEARQAELLKSKEVDDVTALGRIQSEIALQKDRITEKQRDIEKTLAEIDAIKKRTAETDRARQAQDDFNASVSRENAVYEVRLKGRAAFSTFQSKADVEERQELEKLLGQYERQYDLEIRNGDANSAVTLTNIANTQARISALEQEAAMQQRVGAMAEAAIAGTAAGAFDAYADALDKTVSLNALFQSSTDRTLRNVAASTIRNVGRQAAIEGAMESARALAALAIGNTAGASGHAAAAAGFFGVAAAAGAAAGAVSVKSASAGGGGGGNRGSTRGDGSGGPVINLTVIGEIDYEGKQRLAAAVAEVVGAG